mgnify:CR=1 FL=1
MKKYPHNSLYHHDSFGKKKFAIRQKMTIEILSKFLIMFEYFHLVNKLINYGNAKNDTSIEAERIFTCIEILFTLGMIEDEKHKAIFEEMIYEEAAKGLEQDKIEIAILIESKMRKKILELRDS